MTVVFWRLTRPEREEVIEPSMHWVDETGEQPVVASTGAGATASTAFGTEAVPPVPAAPPMPESPPVAEPFSVTPVPRVETADVVASTSWHSPSPPR